MTYEKKLKHYNAQNLLARSLNADCYKNNPGFRQFLDRTGLPFTSYEDFTAQAVLDRGTLYEKVAQQIWNPEALLIEDRVVTTEPTPS
jgi:hypothetical protein